MTKKDRAFIDAVYAYYNEHGRHTLPWRTTKDPYKILVSEVMLQQTQVDRVLPKYKAFLQKFPTVHVLAHASLRDVFRLWQGLGYNRRAKMLHVCAQKVVSDYGGRFPRTQKELQELPGIGPYTAAAVCAFAFNSPVVLIETNVRSVFLHHFHKDKTQVADAELLVAIERTLDCENPRTWYWALMDYGSYIKKTYGNPNAQSLHHTKQSRFEGSDRQIRGALLRLLLDRAFTRASLHKALSHFDIQRIDVQLARLKAEELIVQKGRSYELPS